MRFDNEKELEDYLTGNITEGRNHKYYDPVTKCRFQHEYRQVRLADYGIADIIRASVCPAETHFQIIELKNIPIDYAAIGQICRYKTAVERCLGQKPYTYCAETTVTGMLVGPSITDEGDVPFLINELDWLQCRTFELTFGEGISFKDVSSGWHKGADEFSENLESVILQIIDEQKRIDEGAEGNVDATVIDLRRSDQNGG